MKRRGIMLVECLVLMTALAAVLAVSMSVIVALFRTELLVRSLDESLARRAAIAEAFRADVHAADGVEEHWNQYDASEACLILRRGEEHVVWDWRDGNLVRHALEGKKLFLVPGSQPPRFVVSPDRMTVSVDVEILAARRQP